MQNRKKKRIGELQTFLPLLQQLEMPSPLFLLSLALLLLLPAIPAAQPRDLSQLLTSGRFSLSSGSKGMKETVGWVILLRECSPPNGEADWGEGQTGEEFSGKEWAECFWGYEQLRIVVWMYSVVLKSSFFVWPILSKAPLAALSGLFLPFASNLDAHTCHVLVSIPQFSYSHHQQEKGAGFVSSLK